MVTCQKNKRVFNMTWNKMRRARSLARGAALNKRGALKTSCTTKTREVSLAPIPFVTFLSSLSFEVCKCSYWHSFPFSIFRKHQHRWGISQDPVTARNSLSAVKRLAHTVTWYRVATTRVTTSSLLKKRKAKATWQWRDRARPQIVCWNY